MLTSKQRAYLRGLANTMDPILQIGKGGINDNLLRQLDDALEARELIKVVILRTASLDTYETCDQIASAVKAEPVQSIGGKFVLYRPSQKNKRIQL